MFDHMTSMEHPDWSTQTSPPIHTNRIISIADQKVNEVVQKCGAVVKKQKLCRVLHLRLYYSPSTADG